VSRGENDPSARRAVDVLVKPNQVIGRTDLPLNWKSRFLYAWSMQGVARPQFEPEAAAFYAYS
jgi:hypothetical protein